MVGVIEVASTASGSAGKAQVINLGVDTHAERYTVAPMVDHQGLQPPQSMGREEFSRFVGKQPGPGRGRESLIDVAT